MATKELMTRIALKYDSYANWNDESKEGLGANLVLLPGELGICYVGDTNQESNVVPTVLFKVGDGQKTFKQLPWASAKAADVYSWAKASDVVYNQTNKTITFVKGNVDGTDKVITFNYMTEADVKGITDGLTTRIAALEGKFTGESSVQGQIDALDGRLDVIEGEGEGSVKKALADAKAYTDEREDAIEAAYKKYTDDTDAARKTYVDGKVTTLEAADSALSNRIAALEGDNGAVANALKEAKEYADQAELDAIASAKTYTDGRETAITTAYQTYADQAEADAKKHADDELAKAVETQATVDANQNAEIAKKLDKSVYDAYIDGKSMSDAELKSYADGVAGTAKSEAIAAAKTETEGQVSALANGQVKTNKEAIAAMDAAYKAADEALDGRLDTVEAKLANVTNVMDFRGAVSELPASTEGYQNGDVIVVTDGDNKGKEYVVSDGVFVEFGNTDANSAAISALQGRMNTAESDIDKLEKADEDLAAADTAIEGRLDVIEGDGVGSIKKAQADAEANTKSYTDGRETAIRSELKIAYEAYADKAEEDAVKSAKEYTDAEIDKLETKDAAIEGNIKTLQDLTSGYTGEGSIKAAVDAAQKAADDAQDAADAAQSAADKAQGEIDALELIVGDANTGLAKTKEIADKATTDIAALTTRMGTAESDIDALQAIVSSGDNTNAKLREDITALQTLTGENGAIRSEIADAKKAGTDAAQAVADLTNGQVKTNKENIEDHETRIAAIEADYLKQADLFIINCGTSTTVTHEQPKA